MSKYVAPSLRKEKTQEESTNILREMSEDHFPSLSGFKPADTMPMLERAAQWESKHIQARINDRTKEYTEGLRKRREEEEQAEARLVFAKSPKKEVQLPAPLEYVPEETIREVDPEEWILVKPKPRKTKVEKVFSEEDYIDEGFVAEED